MFGVGISLHPLAPMSAYPRSSATISRMFGLRPAASAARVSPANQATERQRAARRMTVGGSAGMTFMERDLIQFHTFVRGNGPASARWGVYPARLAVGKMRHPRSQGLGK